VGLQPAQPRVTSSGPASPCNRTTALLLAILGPMFGLSGLQRFYVGKVGTGILWLFTWGLCGIGQLIDIILIIAGSFRDRSNLPLLVWKRPKEATAAGAPPKVWAAAASPSPEPMEVAEVKVVQEPPQPQPQVPPAAYQPPSWPSYSRTTSIYQPWDPIGGLLAAIGHILAFAAIVIGLAIDFICRP